ncbi:chondroitin AC/alginate lyase [Marasmius fiardii PR-910]|nr:chondroitin AC/alginate lyase [Marasmius fiardii PR-910]
MDETVPLPQAPLGNPKFQVPASVTPTASHSTSERMAGTAAPAQNAVKTKKSSCTPSPTSSMPPSATWTICPYVNRDGQVNPDTRSIKDPGHINDAGQSMLYNAVSYGLSQDPTYSKRVADFVNTLLLDPKTGMNTNANYGQIVRGPGAKGTTGSWTGILDLRGLTKAYNAIAILRAMHSAEWTPAMDKSLQGWTEKWTDWLVTSSLGQKAGTRPNNHGTFYTYQLAGAQLATGNAKGAGETIKRFIETSFQDQIAASGEQPYEAVRTRPYHYRCFNLEALIVRGECCSAEVVAHSSQQGIAKIGDEIGMNVWGDRTKHGANIKDALDYVMTVDPKREDRSQIVPHVLAVATAYGDPTGEYASFLQEHSPKYRTKSSWFYNQPDAFPSTHRNREGKRGVAWPKDDDMPSAERDSVTFTCPRIFTSEPCVELDLGVCVTCEQLEEFFSS